MARQAEIYYEAQLAGYLVEGDNGYSFTYLADYLEGTDAKPVSLTLPLSENPHDSKVGSAR